MRAYPDLATKAIDDSATGAEELLDASNVSDFIIDSGVAPNSGFITSYLEGMALHLHVRREDPSTELPLKKELTLKLVCSGMTNSNGTQI